MAFAKENNMEMTEESAKAYFDLIHPKTGDIPESELDNVSGGGCHADDGREIVTVGHGCGGCFAVCADKALKPVGRELGELEYGTVLDGTVRFLMGRTRIGESMTPPLLRRLRARLDAMLAAVPADAILDAPPGVSCPAVTVTRDVDLILLVADPTPFGFHDFKLAHQAFLPLGKAMTVVINRAGAAGNADGDAAVRDYCREHGLPLLAELPFERAAAEQYANGRLLAALSPEWKQRFEHLRDALRRLGGEVCHA